jgi:hypothetical protein
MKKVLISLGILLCLSSCIDYSTARDIKVGQMFECGENPFDRDTIVVMDIREDYFKFYSRKRRAVITDHLLNLGSEIDCQDCKLITKL